MIKSLKILAISALLATATSANAGVINPLTGASGGATWSSPVGTDLDPIVAVTSWLGMSGHEHTITVTSDSFVDVHIADMFGYGDAFALFLDGVELAPTSGNLGANTRGPGATEFFEANWDDVFLSTGTHTFGLFVTDACCSGGGTDQSSVSMAITASEPGIVAMFGLGLLGMGLARRRA